MPSLRRQRDPEGRMSLGDHLRELRNRITISAIAILIGGILGWVYYNQVINALTKPLTELQKGREGVVNINFAGMTDAFALQLTTSLFVGLILASPVWLFQIWGFIVPGLTKKEKLIARLFVVAAVPLFLAGCFFAFIMVPKAVAVLLGFTPEGAYNLQDGSQYLYFASVGVAFLLDRRKEEHKPDWLDVPDDQASAL